MSVWTSSSLTSNNLSMSLLNLFHGLREVTAYADFRNEVHSWAVGLGVANLAQWLRDQPFYVSVWDELVTAPAWRRLSGGSEENSIKLSSTKTYSLMLEIQHPRWKLSVYIITDLTSYRVQLFYMQKCGVGIRDNITPVKGESHINTALMQIV